MSNNFGNYSHHISRHLLYAKHCSKHFTSINYFILRNYCMRWDNTIATIVIIPKVVLSRSQMPMLHKPVLTLESGLPCAAFCVVPLVLSIHCFPSLQYLCKVKLISKWKFYLRGVKGLSQIHILSY